MLLIQLHFPMFPSGKHLVLHGGKKKAVEEGLGLPVCSAVIV